MIKLRRSLLCFIFFHHVLQPGPVFIILVYRQLHVPVVVTMYTMLLETL
jgi:hypothetical protein